jgi:hypothetical protein
MRPLAIHPRIRLTVRIAGFPSIGVAGQRLAGSPKGRAFFIPNPLYTIDPQGICQQNGMSVRIQVVSLLRVIFPRSEA